MYTCEIATGWLKTGKKPLVVSDAGVSLGERHLPAMNICGIAASITQMKVNGLTHTKLYNISFIGENDNIGVSLSDAMFFSGSRDRFDAIYREGVRYFGGSILTKTSEKLRCGSWVVVGGLKLSGAEVELKRKKFMRSAEVRSIAWRATRIVPTNGGFKVEWREEPEFLAYCSPSGGALDFLIPNMRSFAAQCTTDAP